MSLEGRKERVTVKGLSSGIVGGKYDEVIGGGS